ncbi:ankyrin repeat domain-containing protein [Aspergillus undulatus]|uniref:ankyrin repeat domain-containing protein n=1 Tax=Aspergillus undulatus TaxID=1810928 RepID=UPI003CCCDD7E
MCSYIRPYAPESQSAALRHFIFARESIRGVNTLHIASLFWDANVVKLLLEHTGPDLVCSRDTNGRLPLHWAAAGTRLEECKFPDGELGVKIAMTFLLLLSANASAINFPEARGSTAQHHAVETHAGCGGRDRVESAIRCLLEHGADPRFPDSQGHKVLHILRYNFQGGEPDNATVFNLLTTHGANVNHTDKNGNTALHTLVVNLRQITTVKLLLDHRAYISRS